jgi:hypothetical protein
VRAEPLLLVGPRDGKGLQRLALLLLSRGEVVGGFLAGREIDAATAQAMLGSGSAWRVRE